MKLKAMFLLCKPLLQFFLQFNHLLSGAVSKYQHFAKLLHLHLFRFSQRKTGARQRLCLFKCCMLFSYPVSRFRAFSSFMTLTISTPTQNARNISEQTLGCHETKMMDVRIFLSFLSKVFKNTEEVEETVLGLSITTIRGKLLPH